MASIEMNASDHKKVAGVKRAKRLSTKVDMTPMVDLGFLLITFFIFTTTMSTPTTMKLIVPKNADNMPIKASGALTVVIGKDESIYYYEGKLEKDGVNFIKSNLNDIRKVIINKKKEAISKGIKKGYPSNDLDQDLVVIIKPYKNATYKSIVDVLDEMSINGVRRYALIDATEEECKLMNAN